MLQYIAANLSGGGTVCGIVRNTIRMPETWIENRNKWIFLAYTPCFKSYIAFFFFNSEMHFLKKIKKITELSFQQRYAIFGT